MKQNRAEALFHIQKAFKIAELTLQYYDCVRDSDFIGALNILIISKRVMATYFIPGNNINNSLDRLWLYRATNQIRINLTWIKYIN